MPQMEICPQEHVHGDRTSEEESLNLSWIKVSVFDLAP